MQGVFQGLSLWKHLGSFIENADPWGPLPRPSKSVSRNGTCKSAINHTPQGFLHVDEQAGLQGRTVPKNSFWEWGGGGPPEQPHKPNLNF